MGNESVLCPVCQGVLPASGKESYTALRGRLIVTNGYCAGGCAERRAEMEQQQAQRQAQQQTQQMARPQGLPSPAPVPGPAQGGRAALRVVR
ncbi:hypothetical protein FXF51_57920 [Nonomuraea sp. PA05]|uniref:hypothetical protein n=1 Tax=Nonomuraea sp. PA05 TaxID=2604466 RepID=UPI0011D55A3C|nr:hypothetical protein [Nonomuraea sp. PA05]TYB47519.1 hypothetical protein FXF51_57920 [Nonomuraea sp. PA05]